MNLAIVIPAWNNWAYTKRALSDLSHLPQDHGFVVVDNGSTDSTKQLQSSARLSVVRHQKNLGFAKGCNTGFEKAVSLGYENVMFLNNDIRIAEENSSWTEPIIREVKNGCLVGPTVGLLDIHLNFVREMNKLPTTGFLFYLSGWNITASVATWNRLILEGDIGPFSTKFISYFEDTDLSFRAKELGIELKVVDAPVRHIGRVTGKKVLSDLYLKSKKTFIEIWGNK